MGRTSQGLQAYGSDIAGQLSEIPKGKFLSESLLYHDYVRMFVIQELF